MLRNTAFAALGAVALLATSALTAPANAIPITSSSDFSVDWTATVGTTKGIVTDTAEAVFSNFVIDSTTKTVTFDLSLGNTSTTSNPGLIALGWTASTNPTSVTETSINYTGAKSVAFGGGAGTDSVCLYSGAACNSNTSTTGGLAAGQTDNFSVKLTYGTLPSSLTFTGFDARFDNASSTTAFAVATVADGTAIVAPPPATVAEPAALGVLTVGLIGLAIAKRRRGDGNAMSAAFA